MSSDQIDPADLTRAQEHGTGDGDVVERLQRLWSVPQEKSPSPFLQSEVDRIDRFEIIRMLGQGGMGRVYLAHDSELDRKVAIKVPLFDSDTDPTILERFRREGRAAGAINHPNVVAVHEVGDTNQGFYIVSEYVQGPTLREYLRRRDAPLTARAAATLMLAVARGVQVAHQQGVIHRDLKPSNVLMQRIQSDVSDAQTDSTIVQIGDDVLRPRVADFGLAGFVDGQTAITMSGALVGTPSYMAPEQITGTPLGPPADVFSLGVILYELITGSSPFAGESYVATIERIQSCDPLPLTRMDSSTPADLSAICECAINKEPQCRYADAGEFADDLQRYLDGQPVRARSLGPIGRLQRWVRRHPAQAALITVICTALVTSLVQNRRLQTSLNRSAELRRNLASTATELTESNAKYRETIYVQDMIAAFDALKNHAIDDVRTLLDRHLPNDAKFDLRGIEWHTLNSLIENNSPREFLGHDGAVYDIAVLPDGKRFFSVGEDRRRILWDIDAGNRVRVSEPETIGRSHAIAMCPDGEIFVTGGNLLMAHNVEDGTPIRSTPITHHKYGIRAIAISPDQRFVASLCLQHQIHLNSIDESIAYAKKLNAVPAQRCTRIDFSPNGRNLYFTKQLVDRGSREKLPKEFVVWDTQSGQEVFSSAPTHYSGYFGPVDASADGSWVAIGGFRHVQLYDPKKKRFHTKFRTTESRVLDLEFSPDSTRIAGSNQDGTLFTANLKAGDGPYWSATTAYRARPYNEAVNAVAWVGNDKLLAGDDEGRILLHTITHAQQIRDFKDAHTCQLDDSGRRLLVIDKQGIAKLFDVDSNTVLHQMNGLPRTRPRKVCIDASGRYVALAANERCQLWDLRRKKLQCEIEHRSKANRSSGQVHRIMSVSISPDSQHFVTTGGSDDYALIWDLETGERVAEIMLPKQGYAGHAVFSPFGDYLVCTSSRGGLLVDMNSGEQTLLDVNQIVGIRWISRTEFLLSGESGLTAIYNIDSGNLESVLAGQSHIALRFAISPNRQTLVTGQNSLASFWHVPTRRLMGQVPLGTESINFSPDGTKLYFATRNEKTKSCELHIISKEPRQAR